MAPRPIDVLRFVGRSSKRIAVTVVGATLVTTGLAMLVLPGPGLLVIIAGLAVLATEYAWAAVLLDKAKDRASRATKAVKGRFRRGRGSRTDPPPPRGDEGAPP